MPNFSPSWPVVILSPYEAFPELAMATGLAPADCRCLSECTGEDIRHCHVISDQLPLTVAAYAAVVTIIPLNLPPELQTRQAPLSVLTKFAGAPCTYWVRSSAEAWDKIVANRGSSVAKDLAEQIAADATNLASNREALASLIDQGLRAERSASVATERLLLTIIESERRRRDDTLRSGNQQAAPQGPPRLA
jgi:hypothetical protein